MKSLLEILMVSLIIAQAYAQQAPNSAGFPGRYLPGGIWQARNMHATLTDPYPGMAATESAPDGRQEIASIEWEPDVRLTYDTYSTFYPAIAAGPNSYVHCTTGDAPSFEPIYIRSTDQGQSWGIPYPIAESTGIDMVYPIFLASSSYVTLIPGSVSIVSTDYGDSWLHWVYIYVMGRGLPNAALLGERIYSAPTTDDHRAMCHFSDDFGQTWQYHSQSMLRTYDDVHALGATNLGLHMLIDWSGVEVFYERYLFPNSGWGPSIMISGDTTHGSFLPMIAAWGDSNIFAIWVDYEYSPYPWTGDLICRRSTDNGDSWLPEQQVTFNHLALNKNICIRGDSIFLVYDEIVLDGETDTEEIFFNLSCNAGASWGEPARLTYAPWRSIFPCVAVRDNRIHVAWCDARNDTLYGNHNSLYYKRGTISDVGIGWNNGEERLPEKLSLGAYPNPFNSSTMITVKGSKGGDITISIYDIQGKRIKTFEKGVMGGDEKIVWDATDASGKKVSSGLYFARASTPQTENTIKLLLLR